MKCKTVAVTGLIGSGKSVVGNYLRQKGFKVIDCDTVARKIAQDPEVISEVERLLGSRAVAGGSLDRSYIRDVIFNDADLRTRYNALFHKRIEKEILTTAEKTDGLLFAEVPLMDVLSVKWFKVWQIVTPDEARFRRAALRDGRSVEDIRGISATQKACSDVCDVIVNDGDIPSLYSKVDRLLQDLQ